jgi:hypothetical protein
MWRETGEVPGRCSVHETGEAAVVTGSVRETVTCGTVHEMGETAGHHG